MNETALVHYGGEVKALGDGRVSGYLVVFGTAEQPDLSAHRDYFTKETDLDIQDGDRKSVYFAHGLDPQLKTRRIGNATVKTDDVGVWIEAQLSLRDEYEKAVYDLVEAGKMGWSSGAPSHLVTRKAVETKSGGTVHEILSWNLSEASLTPTPAEPRADAFALKSLSPIIGLNRPEAEDHTTKALPTGMSYDDLRSLLQDELNEDIGDDDGDMMGCGLWIVDIFDDALVYRDSDDGDLIRIPYTVTSGNDVTWGTPENVIRVTTYATATEGDDTTMKSQADVTAIKQMLTRSMTFGDHADVATSAMAGFVARAEGLADTATKAGRMISAANRDKMRSIHQGMQVAHDAMAAHMGKMGDLLAATDPDAKKAADEVLSLRMQHERIKARALSIAV